MEKTDNTLVISRPSDIGSPNRVGFEARDNAEAVILFKRDLDAA
jgi:hypothetical protein